jgi:hypothetical protein
MESMVAAAETATIRGCVRIKLAVNRPQVPEAGLLAFGFASATVDRNSLAVLSSRLMTKVIARATASSTRRANPCMGNLSILAVRRV